MDPQMLAGPLKIQRKAFTKIGKELFIYDQSGNLLLFVKQKGFKLKEDIRVFSDDSKTEERLSIQARKVTMLLALLRRFLTNLIPQKFEFIVGGEKIAELKQHFNPFVLKADFALAPGGAEKIDPRLAVAGVVMLMVMEGRQG